MNCTKHQKYEYYIVGGWLRSKLLKKQNRDLDLAVSSSPEKAAKTLASKFKGRVVKLDETNGIYRIILKDHPGFDYIDVAAFKGKTIIEDLKKRDFTINSLATAFATDLNLIDPLNGLKDLKNKIIRVSSQTAFDDDPLRLLRAFRFASQLNFKIETKTARLIKTKAKLIKKSAFERIRDEFFKILSCDNSIYWIREIDKSGILEVLLPEIAPMKKSARKFYYHPQGLWQHSMETMESLELIAKDLKKTFPDSYKQLSEHFNTVLTSGVTRITLLKLVALLHDSAKPFCAKRLEGKMRFLGHESKGATNVSLIAERFKLGKAERNIAKLLVEHHMRPISLGQSPKLTNRAIYRLLRDMGNNVPDLMVLTLADCYSYRRLKTKKTVEFKKMVELARQIVSKYFEESQKAPMERIVDGNILIKHFKIKPGPIIGKLLAIANEAQSMGKISTKKEAITLLTSKLTLLKKKYKMGTELRIKK